MENPDSDATRVSNEIDSTKVEDAKMKPVVILQNGSMSKADIQRLRANGICVVESKNPTLVRWMEPYPQGYSVQDQAAMELAYTLLRDGKVDGYTHRATIGSMYADILIRGRKVLRVKGVSK